MNTILKCSLKQKPTPPPSTMEIMFCYPSDYRFHIRKSSCSRSTFLIAAGFWQQEKMSSPNHCCLHYRRGEVSWNEILCAPFGFASSSSYLQLNLTRRRTSTLTSPNSGLQLRPRWKDQGNFELRRKRGQKLCWLVPRTPSFFLHWVQSTCFCLELTTGGWSEPGRCLSGRRLIIQDKSRNWCPSFPLGKGPTSQSVSGCLSRVFGVDCLKNTVFKAQALRVELFSSVVLCPCDLSSHLSCWHISALGKVLQ